MEDRKERCSRRKFLTQAAVLTVTGGVSRAAAANCHARPPRPTTHDRKPLAAVCTVYRPLSDAYHLLGRFLHGYARDGRLHVPGYHLASLYIEQQPDNDLSRQTGREFDLRVTRSIAEALTLGGQSLAVEGVLLIGEHGNYPRNERGQILYPRYEMLQQVTNVFRQTGQSVPVYHHKHLSHQLSKAQEMAQWSRELGFPLMAGSSIGVAERRPALELPMGATVQEALVTAYGPTEVYGSLAIEALQTLLAKRAGGETGVRAVTCLTGQAVWRAGDAGQWSWELLDAALSQSETCNLGDVRRNVGALAVGSMPALPPTAIQIEYRDGTRGTVLLLNGHTQDFCMAARVAGSAAPLACQLVLPALPGARHFDRLAGAIEEMLVSKVSPYPLERAVLTAGVLEAAMSSHQQRGLRLETPEL